MTQRLPQLFTLIDCEISIGINPPTMCLSPFKIHPQCVKCETIGIDYKKCNNGKKQNRKNEKNWQNSWHTDEFEMC